MKGIYILLREESERGDWLRWENKWRDGQKCGNKLRIGVQKQMMNVLCYAIPSHPHPRTIYVTSYLNPLTCLSLVIVTHVQTFHRKTYAYLFVSCKFASHWNFIVLLPYISYKKKKTSLVSGVKSTGQGKYHSDRNSFPMHTRSHEARS